MPRRRRSLLLAEEIVLHLKAVGGLGKSPYPQKAYPTEPRQLEYSYVIDTERFKHLTLQLCADAGVDLAMAAGKRRAPAAAGCGRTSASRPAR